MDVASNPPAAAAAAGSDDEVLGSHSRAVAYAPQVEAAIKQVFPSDDPLDSPDFNPVNYINALFPTEQSLANVDAVIKKLQGGVRKLNTNIHDIVHSQTNVKDEGRKALENAQKSINELFSRINDIKGRAGLSESMVKEITRDIKTLDYAKKNLTASMTTLNHLNMLVGSVETLKSMTKQKQYHDAANLLVGCGFVMDHFAAYKSIRQIAELSDSLDAIKLSLRKQIMADFEEAISNKGALSYGGPHLHEGCMVLDVLQKDVKADLIKWFVRRRLSEYVLIYGEGLEPAHPEKIDRRYAWLARNLTDFDHEFKDVFPTSWNMAEYLCREFCEVTYRDLTSILASKKYTVDMKLLLNMIRVTRGFEASLEKRFGTRQAQQHQQQRAELEQQLQQIRGADEEEEEEEVDAALSGIDPNDPQAEVRRRYLEYKKQKARERQQQGKSKTVSARERKKQLLLLQQQQQAEEAAASKSRFVGAISVCFEPYMHIFVDAQDKSIGDMIERFAREFRASDTISTQPGVEPSSDHGGSAGAVFTSATDLFQGYKEILRVHVDQLSVREPLLELSRVFGKHLKNYGNRLLTGQLPKHSSTAAASAIAAALHTGDVRMSREELVLVCGVLNTASHCSATTKKLEEKIKQKIDPEFADRVDMSEHEDFFHDIIANCLQILIQGLEAACEPSFQIMLKMTWNSVESVGDQSDYVTSIAKVFANFVPTVRETVADARYFSNFCLKFATSFVPRVQNAVFRVKPNQTGVEQLLLDMASLKAIVLDMQPVKAQLLDTGSGSGVASTPFSRLVQKTMSKIDMILKVVLQPHEQAEVFVQNYLNYVAEPDINIFQKILDMKNLRKQEQVPLLEQFRQFLPAPPSSAPGTGGASNSEETSRIDINPTRLLNNLTNLSKDLSSKIGRRT
ncbi:vacuolar protein sorting 53 [Capsaspora owczarzaki ATCC 30864]|uniref:Vacuolar protein sorting 53 n=1 Tax=Capsaspora owczarzaki (strain ATCC 30864) TaxID=595528 RepID=A0A0D2WTT6_CAPO3|nr:vacuolar protein sorting 53 [Capsaspora owczarzaki ATCC 30864]KJE95118.1 vacuolar protein sorting 53 [Capsaspora owczarzaki ATCC 30864]|eukprot:XP_004346278.2 vacuolar protein sorting 53 [Capsaspora owczarzaki ATCC 30864]